MDAFDVVLVSDQSMTVPNAVLRQILYAAETSVVTSNCDATATHPCDSNQLQPHLDAWSKRSSDRTFVRPIPSFFTTFCDPCVLLPSRMAL